MVLIFVAALKSSLDIYLRFHASLDICCRQRSLVSVFLLP